MPTVAGGLTTSIAKAVIAGECSRLLIRRYSHFPCSGMERANGDLAVGYIFAVVLAALFLSR